MVKDRSLKMLTFNGGLEREWTFDSAITCIKFVGGPMRKETVLVGLHSGDIFKIFAENPFPINLIHQTVPVRSISMSCDLKKLAVIDDLKNLSVYNVISK